LACSVWAKTLYSHPSSHTIWSACSVWAKTLYSHPSSHTTWSACSVWALPAKRNAHVCLSGVAAASSVEHGPVLERGLGRWVIVFDTPTCCPFCLNNWVSTVWRVGNERAWSCQQRGRKRKKACSPMRKLRQEILCHAKEDNPLEVTILDEVEKAIAGC
jgi:hypothetical protein